MSTLQDDDEDLRLSRYVKREQGQCDLNLVARGFFSHRDMVFFHPFLRRSNDLVTLMT